jgi:hypothetical protein
MARFFVICLLALALPCTALADPKQVKPDRKAVTALLDEFVPDAVVQKNLQRAWELTAGDARTTSHADWLKGNTSVQTYPAKGSHFPGWTVNYSYPGDVGFDLLLQPANASVGAWSFRGEAKKIDGAWKIVSWYTVATFAPAGKTQTVLGPNDLGPGNASSSAAGSDKGRLPPWVLAVPLLGVGGLALIACGFGGVHWLRKRSRVREIERSLAR